MTPPRKVCAFVLLLMTFPLLCLGGSGVESGYGDETYEPDRSFIVVGQGTAVHPANVVAFSTFFSGPRPWTITPGSVVRQFELKVAPNASTLHPVNVRFSANAEDSGDESSPLPEDNKIGSIPEPSALLFVATGLAAMLALAALGKTKPA